MKQMLKLGYGSTLPDRSDRSKFDSKNGEGPFVQRFARFMLFVSPMPNPTA